MVSFSGCFFDAGVLLRSHCQFVSLEAIFIKKLNKTMDLQWKVNVKSLYNPRRPRYLPSNGHSATLVYTY